MKAIPVAIRERIIQLYDQGKSTTEIATSFGYCVAAVRRVRQHFKERGTLKPQTHRCGRKTLLTDSRKARLLQLLAQRPDATLAELGALPKHADESARAWLYGKLLVALLGQKLERLGRDISPWGYRLPHAWQWQRVAGF